MIPCMLARDFIKGMNLPKSVEGTSPPEGWIGSEKYDGYRSIWDSKKKHFYPDRIMNLMLRNGLKKQCLLKLF